jgi:hypothetical protein
VLDLETITFLVPEPGILVYALGSKLRSLAFVSVGRFSNFPACRLRLNCREAQSAVWCDLSARAQDSSRDHLTLGSLAAVVVVIDPIVIAAVA